MASPARLAANRMNARRSTGPRTPAGRQAVAQNAVRHGLYATAALLPALGETAADWAAFRSAVAAGLHPEGAAEHALADRVAYLLWRQRRVAAYAPAVDPAALPPDPDAVTADQADRTVPPRPGAPPAFRLAHARDTLRGLRGGLAADRAAAAALAGGDVGPLSWAAGRAATAAAEAVLGWAWAGPPDPWVGVLAGLGVEVGGMHEVRWTSDLIRRAVAAAGAAAGRDEAAFLAAVRAAVGERVERAAAAVVQKEAEEGALVADLRAARAQAAAGAVVAADPRAARADRVEAHLARELDRARGQLERLRAMRSGAG